MAKKKKSKIEYRTYNEKGQRYMICRNSAEDKSYWGWNLLKDIPTREKAGKKLKGYILLPLGSGPWPNRII